MRRAAGCGLRKIAQRHMVVFSCVWFSKMQGTGRDWNAIVAALSDDIEAELACSSWPHRSRCQAGTPALVLKLYNDAP